MLSGTKNVFHQIVDDTTNKPAKTNNMLGMKHYVPDCSQARLHEIINIKYTMDNCPAQKQELGSILGNDIHHQLV